MHDEEECSCGKHDKTQEEHGEEQQRTHSENCCCGRHAHHGHHVMNRERQHHDGCNCGHPHGYGFRRQFISKEEVVARLEDYLKELRAEAKGVEEHIEELKKEGESKQK
jgi:hypothetical protein